MRHPHTHTPTQTPANATDEIDKKQKRKTDVPTAGVSICTYLHYMKHVRVHETVHMHGLDNLSRPFLIFASIVTFRSIYEAAFI